MATFFLLAHRGLSVARRFARVSLLTVFAEPHVMAADITAMDPFGTAKYIPASPSSDVLSPIAGADPCALGPMGSPLSLFEAIERSLCNSPRTHETWANIKESAAQLGQSEAGQVKSRPKNTACVPLAT